MPGVLLREGISRGPAPTLEVLSVQSKAPARQSSDLLPYIQEFRPLFAPLPSNAGDMDLKVLKVPLSDVECITKTVVKVKGPSWYLKVKKGIDTLNRLI